MMQAQSKNEGLLASKVCHDLASSLTHIVFIKEDLLDGTVNQQTCIKDLMDGIDLLCLRLNFFQNIMVQSKHISNLYAILTEICKKNKIEFSIVYEKPDYVEEKYYNENIVCGILYILIHNAIKTKTRNKLQLVFTQEDKIVIKVSNITIADLPQEVKDIMSSDEMQPSIINIFAVYIRNIMNEHKYAVYANEIYMEEGTGVDIIIKSLGQ
ncbi:MAG: hypothetical protein IJ848_02550 [Alphaproteobacteria bacterium]|nr:hypothetical protein [Alphaproteobacteria bacterium]